MTLPYLTSTELVEALEALNRHAQDAMTHEPVGFVFLLSDLQMIIFSGQQITRRTRYVRDVLRALRANRASGATS